MKIHSEKIFFKSLRVLTFISLITFIFSSCSTVKNLEVMQSHESVCDEICNGKSKGDIISLFGPPDRKTEDGYDGEIIVYTQETVNTVSQSNSFFGVWISSKLPVALTNTKSTSKKDILELGFYIDTNNNCYRLRTEGYDFTIYENNEKRRERRHIDSTNSIHVNYGSINTSYTDLNILVFNEKIGEYERYADYITEKNTYFTNSKFIMIGYTMNIKKSTSIDAYLKHYKENLDLIDYEGNKTIANLNWSELSIGVSKNYNLKKTYFNFGFGLNAALPEMLDEISDKPFLNNFEDTHFLKGLYFKTNLSRLIYKRFLVGLDYRLGLNGWSFKQKIYNSLGVGVKYQMNTKQ